MGFTLGFASWALLSIAYAAIEIVWHPITSGAVPAAAAIAICCAGGALMGWWNHRFNSAPEPFAQVVKSALANGSYEVRRPFASFVSFLLPLACGGPVGPEAGLSGFIAAGCTKIGVAIRRACGTGACLTSSRVQKTVIYGIGVAGGVAAFGYFTSTVGGAGIPRFGVPELSAISVAWVIPLTLAGMALSWVFRRCTDLSERISKQFGSNDPLRGAACGLALALASIALPYVLFPGTEQAMELLNSWGNMGGAVLMATAIVKLALLALCLAMGWHGGPFFPLIFSAMCCGLAFSAAFGVDAALAVTVVSAALLGRYTRKAGLALAILLLCVPLRGVLWALLPLLAGAMLPTIEDLAERRASRAKAHV
ncbi:MAG: chloride channel protein [Coriobacteriaceae bacterium]|nr:chloride channel protein [Coriobacteriaceae bacterium]